MNNILGWNKNS